MWKVSLLLIFTLITVPVICFYYDDPLSAVQFDALITLLWVYGIASLLCFVVSSITDNYSQVDKLWSIMPIPYVWIIAAYADYNARLVLMAILVTVWGVRLSLNFARRGGYSIKFWTGEEDYRWSILRAKPGFEKKWKWMLFNLIFISAYQMGLVLLTTLPALRVLDSNIPLGLFDVVIAVLILGFIYIEYLADEQQYIYQTEKYKQRRHGNVAPFYKIGFVHTGLWAYMRHPNYMAEQAVWIAFYFFSVVATGYWINWTITGGLLLVLLFKGSSDFSESISEEKYPEYKNYQKSVGRFLPFKRRYNAPN
jgi:steroid 5-alpha reductase family enzyme